MAESTNRVHVSPGVYASETVDMKTAANSLGVTKLALVGETLKGPAFQPYWISSHREFTNVFGGKSAAKFSGSNYPKYELPFIAEEYLSASKDLCVVRTLGFSGYNAGPAWVITGTKTDGGKKYVIAVLRSRGSYKYRPEYATATSDGCGCQTAYDSLTFNVGELKNVGNCNAPKRYNMGAVSLTNYSTINSTGSLCSGSNLKGEVQGFDASYGNLGRFTINCIVGPSANGEVPGSSTTSASTINIPVSLNKADKDYILNVLGTNNSDGDQPLYVESLYDVAWEGLVINEGYDTISNTLEAYNVGFAADYCGLEPVNGILTKHQAELNSKDLGKRYLYATSVGSPEGIDCQLFNYTTNMPTEASACQEGYIYTVAQMVDSANKRKYVYKAYDESTLDSIADVDEKTMAQDRLKTIHEKNELNGKGLIVYSYEDGVYYKNTGEGHVLTSLTIAGSSNIQVSNSFTPGQSGNLWVPEFDSTVELYKGSELVKRNVDGVTWPVTNSTNYTIKKSNVNFPVTGKILRVSNGATEITPNIEPVVCDLNNYKSSYRYSTTPWVVSNAKGDANNIELNKLFRFHTISDGANSIDEVKVSIENIRPDLGQFDVIVRSFYDNDGSPVILERFTKCTMVPGKDFIGYMIGTIDGQYESKSKYITVEVSESSSAMNSVPAGFLGYSIPQYGGCTISNEEHDAVAMPPIKYNTTFSEDIAKKRQYFGLSDRTGYDYDYFSFKGVMSTIEDPGFMTHGFHLDSRLDNSAYQGSIKPKVSVDGVEGYMFDTVSINARTANQPNTPIIATEDEMVGSIYEDVKTRKFTLMFAGGFDGWDIYRDRRTNTDEFTYSTYKGYINKSDGTGYAFDSFNDGSSYNMEGNIITSDYYSTLAGISLLKNPEEYDFNLLAMPGIDLINNERLSKEVFDILEDRADTLAILTTPDKELGASDYSDSIPSVDEVVSDFENKEIYSDYAATYYPWVKVEYNGEYLWLPPTKDVVRNMAQSDNTNTTMNLAPAGLTRGKVKAVRARKNLKIAECDALYEASINPVRTYAQEGVVIMGQKTLRETDDLLNRIDVRRCVLRMRKLIAIGTLGLIFEPNDHTTVTSFKNIVSGIMDGFVNNRAISNWKMEVDESEEARDRLEIPATIYIKPVRALEYISINFVVTNNGAYFED